MEILSVEQLFAMGGAVDAGEAVGQRRLENTTSFNEIWRPHRIERQLVAPLGKPGHPLALLVLTRQQSEPSFSRRDIEWISDLAELLDEATRTVFDHPTRSRGRVPILEMLMGATTVPQLLCDPSGQLLWINTAACNWLGVRSYPIADTFLLAGDPQRLACISALVRKHARTQAWERLGAEISAIDCDPHRTIEVHPLTDARRVQSAVLVTAVARAPYAALGSPTPEQLWSDALSHRQRQVALLAARGYSVLNIAETLGLRESSVKTYLKRIYRRLGVCSRAELAYALLTSK